MDSGFFPESTKLGRYQIVRRLGGGEANEVLLAIAQGPHGFERVVVLKRVLPQYERDASVGRMLATEAIAYARLTHPAIVRLYDFVDVEGGAVIVAEHVDGPSLAEVQALLRARREALSDPAALYIASRVFAALAAAHAARDPRSGEFAPVVHRDVSPGSVLLPWDGYAKLGDFGFAKVKGLAGDTTDTRHGLLKGTLGYMAPEQVLGGPITPRTDVYAGCLLLRELLVGAPAFPDEMPELERMRAMAETQLAPIETLRGGISPALADAMRGGLARDPEARTVTAADMVRVLRQETDLTLAQTALVDTLARFRSSEVRASTPETGTRALGESPSSTMRLERIALAPEAMPSGARMGNAGDSDSHPTVRYATPLAALRVGYVPQAARDPRPWLTRRRRRVLVAAAALVSVAVCVALGGLMYVPLPGRDEHGTTKVTGAIVSAPQTASAPPPRPAPPAPSAAPPPAAPSVVPAPAPTVGDVTTPARARQHRVFVDGRCAAPRSGATLTLACGAHVVRIGSKGKDQAIEVPCGGSIAVDVN